MYVREFRRVFACLVVAMHVTGLAVQAQPGSPSREPSDKSADAAVAAVEKAIHALQQWQQAVEAGAPLRDKDVARLRAQLQPLGSRLEWLIEHARREQRAAGDTEPPDWSAEKQAQVWVEQMRSLGEGAGKARAAVVAKLRGALEGDDAKQQYAALRTLQQIGDVNYDKEQFRPLILPFLSNAQGHVLVSAAYALYNTKREADDLALIQRAWVRRSPALDSAMSHLLFIFGDGKIDSDSEKIVLELLASPDRNVRREALRGLWGARVSDKLAARLVELANDPESHSDAIYFALSTLPAKNSAVVDKLIETLSDGDWNNWDRALWGLAYGVPKELQPKVARAAADMYTARSDPNTREKCRNLIRKYAGDAAADQLPE